MIIGVSGRKRSGKDLIGKIIQYLITKEKFPDLEFGEDEFCYSGIIGDVDTSISFESDFKVVKFADKLKDIVCLLIDCTREQLEDETFKNTELGEEWWLYNFRASSGEYFAINKPVEYLEVYKVPKNRIEITKPTPRYLLQFIGTSLLRNQLHPQVWVNATMADYNLQSNGFIPIGNNTSFEGTSFPNWIITDCRFPNECEAIKERNGIVIRVNRPSVESDDKHPSEVALDDYKGFDYIIQNDNSIEDLIQRVKDILIKEDII